MNKENLNIVWSKKEKDFLVHYPDRNGSALGRLFFIAFEKVTAWKNKSEHPSSMADFEKLLREYGYDPATLKVSIKRLKSES